MAAVISIQSREVFNPVVVDGNAKLTKAGQVKRVPNNRVTGRSTRVDPIMEKEMVKEILDYIQEKITSATRADYRWQWERNRMYFILAINLRLRVSDMVGARKETLVPVKDKTGRILEYVYPSWTGLKWNDFYGKDGKIKDQISIKELKTGHMVDIQVDAMSKAVIEDYVRKYQPDIHSHDYVFVNRQKKRLSCQTIYTFIKDVTQACGMDGNYGTHSFRKTGIYHLFMDTVDEEGVQWAMVDTMAITGHRTETALLHYLGLDKRKRQEKRSRMEDYWKDTIVL